MEIEKKIVKGVVSEYTGFIWIGLFAGIIIFIIGAVFFILNLIYSNFLFLFIGILFLLLGGLIFYISNRIRKKVNNVVNSAVDN